MSIILAIYLFVISISDVMRKSISLGLLLTGGFLGIAMGFIRIYSMNVSWKVLLAGTFPGILFLLLSFLSKSVGYGDGLILCVVGLCVGLRKCMVLTGISLFLLALFCIGLLIGKKVLKGTRIPYIPFLFIVFSVFEGVK